MLYSFVFLLLNDLIEGVPRTPPNGFCMVSISNVCASLEYASANLPIILKVTHSQIVSCSNKTILPGSNLSLTGVPMALFNTALIRIKEGAHWREALIGDWMRNRINTVIQTFIIFIYHTIHQK